MVHTLTQIFTLTTVLLWSTTMTFGQKEKDSVSIGCDSLKFKAVQQQLNGIWKTKYTQFNYHSEVNNGGEYKSPTRSSAPIFILSCKDNTVFLEWIELTGGTNSQKIIRVGKRRLKLENDSGKRVVYKRSTET